MKVQGKLRILKQACDKVDSTSCQTAKDAGSASITLARFPREVDCVRSCLPSAGGYETPEAVLGALHRRVSAACAVGEKARDGKWADEASAALNDVCANASPGLTVASEAASARFVLDATIPLKRNRDKSAADPLFDIVTPRVPLTLRDASSLLSRMSKGAQSSLNFWLSEPICASTEFGDALSSYLCMCDIYVQNDVRHASIAAEVAGCPDISWRAICGRSQEIPGCVNRCG